MIIKTPNTNATQMLSVQWFSLSSTVPVYRPIACTNISSKHCRSALNSTCFHLVDDFSYHTLFISLSFIIHSISLIRSLAYRVSSDRRCRQESPENSMGCDVYARTFFWNSTTWCLRNKIKLNTATFLSRFLLLPSSLSYSIIHKFQYLNI